MREQQKELPWNDMGLLPGSESDSFGVVPSIPNQVRAWSDFYTSTFYVSDCAGRGASGEVWRGVMMTEEVPTRVVLKRVYSNRGTHVFSSAMREVYFGSLLGHTRGHLSRFMTHFVENEELWLVFRDEGISLYQAIFQPCLIGSLSLMVRSKFWRDLRARPEVVRQIMHQVLEGLSDLHAQGIVHRDIKLENIFIDPASMHVRIGDLGSASFFTKNDDHFFAPLGPSTNEETKRYAPPEANSDTSPVHRQPSFDMWCLGVMWLELILGSTDLGLDTRSRDSICIREPSCNLRERLVRRDPMRALAPVDQETIDLILKLAAFNASDRISASEALLHPVFNFKTDPSLVPQSCSSAQVFRTHLRSKSFVSQGFRTQMEDRAFAGYVNDSVYLACVFDGHNGEEVAEYLEGRLPKLVGKTIEPDLDKCIQTIVSELERDFPQLNGLTGSTLCCAAIGLWGAVRVANVGDSRMITAREIDVAKWKPIPGGRVKFGTADMNRKGYVYEIPAVDRIVVIPDDHPEKRTVTKHYAPSGHPLEVIQVTTDHKPDNQDERKFIENQGGEVTVGLHGRVNGVLAVSRSIGARDLKPYVRSDPDFFNLRVSPGERLRLILATDGVWDVLQNQQAGEIGDAKNIGEEALRRGARDNVAVVTVDIDWELVPSDQCRSIT